MDRSREWAFEQIALGEHRLGKGLQEVGEWDPLELAIWDHYFASYDPWRVDGPIGRTLRDRDDRRAAMLAWVIVASRQGGSRSQMADFMPKYEEDGVQKSEVRRQKARKKETAAERDARVAAAVKEWAGA